MAMLPREKPMAFSPPMVVRCSSTMRVMVVRLTKAATRKKIKGNTAARLAIRSASML